MAETYAVSPGYPKKPGKEGAGENPLNGQNKRSVSNSDVCHYLFLFGSHTTGSWHANFETHDVEASEALCCHCGSVLSSTAQPSDCVCAGHSIGRASLPNRALPTAEYTRVEAG